MSQEEVDIDIQIRLAEEAKDLAERVYREAVVTLDDLRAAQRVRISMFENPIIQGAIRTVLKPLELSEEKLEILFTKPSEETTELAE